MTSNTFKLGLFSDSVRPPFVGLVTQSERVISLSLAEALIGPTDFGRSLGVCRSIDELLQDWDRNFERLQEFSEFLLSRGLDMAQGISAAAQTFVVLPPIKHPGKLVCHAQNYAEHVTEMRKSRFGSESLDLSGDFMGEKAKTWPYAFLKATSALTGANDDILLADGHPKIDWEAEMAVVIGAGGKRITEERAMEHVAGFMTFNDVSCRDNQWRPDRVTLRSDWFSAKSFDTFAPAGPYLVPRAFVANHLDLRITLSVNGETMQNGNTSGLIFTPEEQIAFFSKSMSWHPGDILATGTPSGTGQGLGRFLAVGDVIETEVEGLGVQRNRCIAQPFED
ncbi:fumarylacetoacetate hydrolase family protein [Caballeronia sp. KNU42]